MSENEADKFVRDYATPAANIPMTDEEEETYLAVVEEGMFAGIMATLKTHPDVVRMTDGRPVMRGDLIALAILDGLATFSATNPRVATVRGRREFVEEAAERLKNTIAAIQGASAEEKGATLLVPKRPPLIVP